MEDKFKLFQSALQQTYKAVMFDFDGTLTEIKPKSPVPESLIETLVELSKTVPMALCTARPFNTAYPKMELAFGEHFKTMNWVLIIENGFGGYSFDKEKNEWTEFYRINWPEEFINKRLLADTILQNLKQYIGHGGNDFQYNASSLIMQPSYENADNDEIGRRSDYLEIEIQKIVEKLGDNGKKLRIKNSKLGVIIVPADADKDTGIVKFGNYLKDKKGVEFALDYKEILVIGDQPDNGGNDEMFLKGKIGTPFTAGAILDSDYPIGVFKDENTRLTGPSATEFLLKQVKLAS